MPDPQRATYVDSQGNTRYKDSGADVNPPADTPEQAKADPSSQGANALKPQSALAQKDESDIGRYEYGRAKAERPYLRGAESEINSPRPPLPTYEKIKNEPNPEDYHKYSVEFASASALLGAIAGKWTRAGGTASLNAFAGAMQGWQKGNVQAYEEASKQWEQASKKTLENNNIELAKYKAILEDRKMNIDEKLQGLTIAGYEAQNSVIVGMGKDGNFNGIAQAVDKMAMANQRYGAAVGQLTGVRNDQRENFQGQIEYLNKNPDAARDLQQRDPAKFAQLAGAAYAQGLELKTPPPAAVGSLPPGWTDEQLNYQADLYNKTGQIPSYGFGKDATAIRSAITKRAADRAQSGGQTPGDLVANRADTKSLGQTLSVLQKQKAAVDAFENTAIANGKVLEKLADKVDSSGSPVVLRWLRAGQREIAGDADVNNFHAQMQLYRNEVAKIMTNPNMTGVLTDTARREGEQFLSGDISASMLHSLIPLLNADMGRRKASIDNEIQSVKEQMGASPKAAGGAAAPAAAPAQDDPLGLR